jgi:hypothetical protein
MLNLVTARNAVVVANTEGVALSARDYALAMIESGMPNFMEFKKGNMFAKSAEGRLVGAERKELYSALKAKGHSNPSMVWSRVCDEGYTLQNLPIPARGNSAQSDEGRNEKVWITDKLLVVYKHIMKLDTADFDDVNILVGRALNEMGVDLSEVNE